MNRAFPAAILLAAVAAGLWACDDDKDSNGPSSDKATPPPPSQESGLFGNAIFTYKCVLPSDPQCDFDALGTGAGGSSSDNLPTIATGSVFGLDTKLTAQASDAGAPLLTNLHPTFATLDPATGNITALKAGYTTLGYMVGGDTVDLLDILIADPDGLKVYAADPSTVIDNVSGDISLSSGKITAHATTTFRFRVAAAKDDQPLAGSFPCKWTTSDPDIAKITTADDDNITTIVTGTKTGVATIHVTLGTLATDIPITVGG